MKELFLSKAKMDQTEEWAEEYLIYRGFAPEDIVFEPDGNVPPDFLVEDRIAVEVRRLNQHWQPPSGSPVPVEQLSVPLLMRLRKLLDAFGAPTNNASWYVSYRFRRPQLTKDWERLLRESLERFLRTGNDDRETELQIDDHFSLRLWRRSKPGTRTFILAGGSDSDTGGWVVPELKSNLAICVAEKSRKISPYRSKYPTWWLVLVDFMMGGGRETVSVEHDWDEVLIIHPSEYDLAWELPSSKAT